jgi:hypothetical protein
MSGVRVIGFPKENEAKYEDIKEVVKIMATTIENNNITMMCFSTIIIIALICLLCWVLKLLRDISLAQMSNQRDIRLAEINARQINAALQRRRPCQIPRDKRIERHI